MFSSKNDTYVAVQTVISHKGQHIVIRCDVDDGPNVGSTDGCGGCVEKKEQSATEHNGDLHGFN